MPARFVHIHYRRPPHREEIFTQRLLLDEDEVKITLARNVPFDPPIRILGAVALERGADAVWFTFPHRWHDIGRFHRADGSFTGIYANILTPPVMGEDDRWETTDLFLDVWVDPSGKLTVLDEDEFRQALAEGVISPQEGKRAMEEVERIRQDHRLGVWPPPIVEEWTRERAMEVLDEPMASDS